MEGAIHLAAGRVARVSLVFMLPVVHRLVALPVIGYPPGQDAGLPRKIAEAVHCRVGDDVAQDEVRGIRSVTRAPEMPDFAVMISVSVVGKDSPVVEGVVIPL